MESVRDRSDLVPGRERAQAKIFEKQAGIERMTRKGTQAGQLTICTDERRGHCAIHRRQRDALRQKALLAADGQHRVIAEPFLQDIDDQFRIQPLAFERLEFAGQVERIGTPRQRCEHSLDQSELAAFMRGKQAQWRSPKERQPMSEPIEAVCV